MSVSTTQYNGKHYNNRMFFLLVFHTIYLQTPSFFMINDTGTSDSFTGRAPAEPLESILLFFITFVQTEESVFHVMGSKGSFFFFFKSSMFGVFFFSLHIFILGNKKALTFQGCFV